jgi:hypothetical protein
MNEPLDLSIIHDSMVAIALAHRSESKPIRRKNVIRKQKIANSRIRKAESRD